MSSAPVLRVTTLDLSHQSCNLEVTLQGGATVLLALRKEVGVNIDKTAFFCLQLDSVTDELAERLRFAFDAFIDTARRAPNRDEYTVYMLKTFCFKFYCPPLGGWSLKVGDELIAQLAVNLSTRLSLGTVAELKLVNNS